MVAQRLAGLQHTAASIALHFAAQTRHHPIVCVPTMYYMITPPLFPPTAKVRCEDEWQRTWQPKTLPVGASDKSIRSFNHEYPPLQGRNTIKPAADGSRSTSQAAARRSPPRSRKRRINSDRQPKQPTKNVRKKLNPYPPNPTQRNPIQPNPTQPTTKAKLL